MKVEMGTLKKTEHVKEKGEQTKEDKCSRVKIFLKKKALKGNTCVWEGNTAHKKQK